MSSEPPKPGAIPGWSQQPETPPALPAPDAPTEAVPPPAAPVPQAPAPAPEAPPPAAPVPQAPPTTTWGAPPAPGVPPAAAGGGAPPAGWNPAPAQASSSSGCLRACLILIVIGAVLFFVALAGLAFLGNQLVQTVGVDSEGNIGRPCPFISDDELSDALGARTSALELIGLFDATIGLILDKRVLPDAEDCWITADETTDTSSATGRLVRYTGSDAAAVFAQERQNAAPTSQDQGGGVTLEDPGYLPATWRAWATRRSARADAEHPGRRARPSG
jgi:hypothetical protein